MCGWQAFSMFGIQGRIPNIEKPIMRTCIVVVLICLFSSASLVQLLAFLIVLVCVGCACAALYLRIRKNNFSGSGKLFFWIRR